MNIRRIHAANSPPENKDKYVDYVNRYYDMIQQEKLSNKKKVEDAIKRQNFDIDQIQATNASKVDKSTSSAKQSSPLTESNQSFQGREVSDLVEQQNFRNASRGDNIYPARPEHCCENSKDQANLSIAPYEFSSPRRSVERSYDVLRNQVPVEDHPVNYEACPSNYDFYSLPPPQQPATCTCSCFRQSNLQMPSSVNQIPRANFDLRQLAPARDLRNANSMQQWHGNQHFQYDKRGYDDISYTYPHTHYTAPYYGTTAQHFNPAEMQHSNAASYDYFVARTPLVPKHSQCIHNTPSPLIPKEIQRNPPQKPPSTSFMNSLREEWERNFNAARIERGNNILKNR